MFEKIFKYGTSDGAHKAWEVRHHAVTLKPGEYAVEKIKSTHGQSDKSMGRVGGTYPSMEKARNAATRLNDEAGKARTKAKQSTRLSRAQIDDIHRSLGMQKVKGAVTGKTYYE